MEIEEIAAQNPWWRTKGWEREDRHLKRLEKYRYIYHREGYIPKKRGVIIVYGPRQVGKTTSIKKAISKIAAGEKTTDILYLNGEMIRDRFELNSVVRIVAGLYKSTHIFIDEVSAVKEWERAIKALVDDGIFEEKYVVLTGSSSVNIMKGAERLPGRMAEGQYKFRYYPLSFREVANLYGIKPKTPKEAVVQVDKLNPILYKYFIHGGFIRALNALEKNGFVGEELFAIYSAWIDGELAKIKRSPETATQIMDGIANVLTNDVSWSALAKTISHPTVAEYAEILKNMFVIDYLEKSKRARIGTTKNKKVYFIDPFLYWLALFKSRKINAVGITDIDSTCAGKLAEISTYANILQYLDLKYGENDFDIRRYVRFEKERSWETDFVAKFGKKTYRIECKFGKVVKEREGVVYLTKNTLEENKIPLAVFLLFPEQSLQLLKA